MTDLEREAREAAIDHGMWLAPDDDETNYEAFAAGYYRGWSDKGVYSLRDARAVVAQLVEWAEEEGCDCGQNDPPCALCVGKAFLEATNEDPA